MIKISHLFYFLFFLFFSQKSFGENDKSLTVEADNSIEYFEKEQYYLASGNAIASKDGIILKANKIKAFFQNNEDDNQIELIYGIGNVSITKNKILAKGEHVVYNLKKETIKFSKGNQFFKTQNFYIESKTSLSYDKRKHVANGKGKVKIILEKNVEILADQIKAIFSKNDNSLLEAIGKGNIKISTKSSKSYAKNAKYSKRTNIILLEGDVKIIQNNLSISGQSGMTNLITGISKIIGNKKKQRVKGKFMPIKKKK
tara:strand:+ start:154 stop:924 length:771 start_codon:yes stop_codon:yes gene_type:complete